MPKQFTKGQLQNAEETLQNAKVNYQRTAQEFQKNLPDSSKMPNRITNQFQTTKLVYQKTAPKCQSNSAQNTEVIYQRIAPNCRSELPKNSFKMPKLITEEQFQNAKETLQNAKVIAKEQLQTAEVNYRRTVPKPELKNPKKTYQTAPKHQTELLTNFKPPSWFTKEQLQNAEVIQPKTPK
ncbi:36502_t:CDS:2 [Gigaspora margarita]|uniref:36502_t:CDS:1 n=1 Tax=Gigaspora margarita TaxID=4874 RepID=A0ABN7UHN4_GIGMA|nr:36502_t:CDS:2 [Gigaspora margarita]